MLDNKSVMKHYLSNFETAWKSKSSSIKKITTKVKHHRWSTKEETPAQQKWEKENVNYILLSACWLWYVAGQWFEHLALNIYYLKYMYPPGKWTDVYDSKIGLHQFRKSNLWHSLRFNFDPCHCFIITLVNPARLIALCMVCYVMPSSHCEPEFGVLIEKLC